MPDKDQPQLIAQVDTAVVIKGERTVIKAGQPLPPDVKDADRAELVASKAARAAVNETPTEAENSAPAAKGKGKKEPADSASGE